MTDYLFEPTAPSTIPIIGSDKLYPVNRIFCVGRNYEAHAAEMGAVVDREAPFYFTKSPTTLVMACLLYTSPSPRDRQKSRMPSSA